MIVQRIVPAIVLASTSAAAARTLRGMTRGMTPCELRQWHIDIDNHSPGCSNSWKVPSSWHFPANEARMLYASSNNCCTDIFGEEGECHLSDFCQCEAEEEESCVVKTMQEKADPLDGHCDSNPKWHLDLDTKRGCTNSPRFPDEWKDPLTALDMFFDTSEGCCEKFTSRGGPCPSHDVCGYRVRNRNNTFGEIKVGKVDLARLANTTSENDDEKLPIPSNQESLFNH